LAGFIIFKHNKNKNFNGRKPMNCVICQTKQNKISLKLILTATEQEAVVVIADRTAYEVRYTSKLPIRLQA